MSDIATSSSLFYRIRHTPMRDVLRGRLTGRLDIKQHIVQSGLPQPASELIQRVVRRTHLRSLEKVDVANELIAHFADGMDAGKTIDDLLRSFGNERQAAKLIRRAKLRNRSFVGHAQTIVGRGVVALIVIYVLIGIYFFSGKPSGDLSTELSNYTSQLRPEDGAWPIYQKAEEAQMIGDHRKAADLVRQAATRPAIGYIEPPLDSKSYYPSSLGGDFFEATREHWPSGNFDATVIEPSYELEFESCRAWRHGDRSVPLVADINAMDRLCRQWHPDPSISSFVVLQMFRQEICQIDRTLNVAPTLFSDADLQHLANQIALYRNAADFINLQNTEIQFGIWVRFHFSSGGLNDGRITPAGMDLVVGDWSWQNADRFWRSVVQPAFFLVVPSRAKFTEEFKSEIEESRARFNLPYRQAGWKPLEERDNSADGLFARLRLRTNLYSTMRQFAGQAEDELAHRDGVLVGIALEQYRRANKTYPTSLDQLVPGFLRQIPASRVTGEPVRYRLVNNKPIVYSVGNAHWIAANNIDADGNWLLYPRAGY